MADSSSGNPLESRVEDLFSDAVERQVEERREVGRALEALGNLVKTLDERLARIEASEGSRNELLRAQVDERLAHLESAPPSPSSAGIAELQFTVDGVATQIDAISSRFGESVSGPLGALAEQLDDRLTRLEATDSARDREVRDQVSSLVEHVEVISSRLHDVVAEGLEKLGRRQDDNQQALERAVLSSAADRVDESRRAPDRIHLAGPTPASAQDVAAALAASVPSANEVASAVDASIRDGLASVVDDIRGEVERLRDELFAIRHEVADGIGGIGPLTSRLGTDLEDLAETIGAVRLDIARGDGERDQLRDDVTAVVGSLGDRFSAASQERGQLRDDVTAVVDSLGERLSTASQEGEQLRGDVKDLGTHISDQSSRLDRLAVELPTGVAVSFDERAGALAQQMQAMVTEFAAELSTGLAAASERTEAAEQSSAARVLEINETVASFEKHLRNVRDRLKKGTTDLASQDKTLAAMAGDVTSMGETIGRVIGEMQASLAAEQEKSSALIHEILIAGDERLQQSSQRSVQATDQVIEQLIEAAGLVRGSGDGLRMELSTTLHDMSDHARVDAEAARDEVTAAGARLDMLFDRLASFERGILEHLAGRDVEFARERSLIASDLVEQLTGGLGKRDRKRLAGKLEVSDTPPSELREAPVAQTPEPGARELDLPEQVKRTRRPADQGAKLVPKVAARVQPKNKPQDAANGRTPTDVGRDDLIAINGLGPAKVDALVKALGSPGGVVAASVEEMAAVPGISQRLASMVHDALR